jgi:ketosteroid isomerase-like protein
VPTNKNSCALAAKPFVAIAFAAVALCLIAASGDQVNAHISEEQFRQLVQKVADAWNEGDAAKAVGCFTEDAVYIEPPDRQVYRGRAALFEFFGGDKKPEPPMRMTWHHLGFNAGEQIGFGEYTFQMNRRYHGIVVVKVRGGKISNWREYQYESPLSWEDFTAKNPF